MSPILAVEDLLVLRNATVALVIDSLTVEEGEVLAVIGPNGAGKSTLLLSLAKFNSSRPGAGYFPGSISG